MATQTTTGASTLNGRQVAALAQHQKRRKITLATILTEVAKYAILLILAISFIMPFFWMVTSAIKNDDQIYTIPPVWFPSPVFWNNFWDAWYSGHLNFTLYTYNTVVKYAIPAMFGTVLSSALVAYSFSRIRWYGRNTLFSLVVATLMIPGWVTLVPLFIIFKNLGWLNSFLPLIVPRFFGNAFFIFMLRQFFLTIPGELSDAAKIDGANELQIMFRIILPLSKPALTVVALFSFMDAWNDYLGPLIYNNRDTEWVLALGVEKLRSAVYQVGNTKLAYPYLMAVSTLVTLPIFVAFFFAQRTFIEGISVTGLKG